MKSRIYLLHGLFTLCFCFISCDSREDQRQLDESMPVNSRTKSSNRDLMEPSTPASNASKARENEPHGSAQSTDDSIAEWAWSMMETRPDLVKKAILELSSESSQRQDLIRACALSLLARSKEDAITWANSLGDQASILAAREEIAMALPIEEIDRAVNLLLDQQRITSQGFDNSSTSLLQRWISSKPGDAAQWVIRLPAGPSRETGVAALASEWVQSDAEGALQWLSTQSSQPLVQELSHAMAKTLVEMPDTSREEVLLSAPPSIRHQLEDQVDMLLPPSAPAPSEDELPEGLQNPE